MGRKALAYAKTRGDDAHEIHLELEDGSVRVSVPVAPEVWDRVTVGLKVEVPDGDLTQAQVQAGIRWLF